MRTKLLLLCSLLIVVFLEANATERNDSSGTPIPLTDIPPGSPDHGGFNRAPAASFIIYQDGHTLDFGTACSSCTVTLIDGNEATAFSGIVGTDGCVILPEYLEGLYVIHLIVDEALYEGELEL